MLDGFDTPPSVDIMLLDIRMPGMSGIELMQALQPRLTFPVVAVTGSVEPQTIAELK